MSVANSVEQPAKEIVHSSGDGWALRSLVSLGARMVRSKYQDL